LYLACIEQVSWPVSRSQKQDTQTLNREFGQSLGVPY
jgi:hypothetical protein